MNKHGGFTLIELMVTISVAAVLLAIAVPSFGRFIENWRLTAQANDLLMFVQLARSEAQRLNRQVTMCRVSSAVATGCAQGNTWEHWVIRTGNGTVLKRGSAIRPQTVTITSSLTNDSLLAGTDGLLLNGGVSASGAKIEVSSSSFSSLSTRVLTFSPAGANVTH